MSQAISRIRFSPVRVFLLLVLSTVLTTVDSTAGAADADSRGLLPEDAVVVVEIDRPLRLLDHQLTQKLWTELSESHELKRQLQTPEYDYFRAIAEALEKEFGVGWRQAVDKITAGGMHLALEGGNPQRAVFVLTADTDETMQRFSAFARRLAAAQTPPGEEQPLATETYREQSYYKAGEGYYAVVGRRMIATSDEKQMKQTLDRLLDGDRPVAAPIPGDGRDEPARPKTPSASDPLARINIDMRAIRELPGAADGFAIPTANIALVFFLGDWVDLLRRSDRIVVEASPAEETLNLDVRFSAKKTSVTPGLEGFFAIADDQRAAPVLRLPEAIYSTSWFRDYGALWDARSKLLTEQSRKSVEEGDRQAKTQMALLGASFRPSELMKALGTEFRFVVARQKETPYKIEVEGPIPAAAFVVSLRDEEFFVGKVVPVLRALYGLATASPQPRVRAEESQYGNADLLSLIFADDEASAAQGNRIRFNFSPTYTVSRGHFVIGSTREVVRQVIDELDRQAAAAAERAVPPDSPAASNSRQLISIRTGGKTFQDFQEPLVRNIVFNQGLSLGEATHELGVLISTLSVLEEITVESGFDEQGFQYRVRVGKPKE